MIGEWIKLEHGTPDKPEIFAIAAALGITQGDAFLLCVRFWLWLDRNSCAGNVRFLCADFLDSLFSRPNFSAALIAVGWLKKSRDGGSFTVPHFDWHNGKTAKKRALNARRMSDARERTRSAQEAHEEAHKENTETALEVEYLNTNTPNPENSENKMPEFSGSSAQGAPGTSNPTANGATEPTPAKRKRGRPASRRNGTNPRAAGTNPRATGTNPRATRKLGGVPVLGRFWLSEAATVAAGKALGLEAKIGETWEQFRERISSALEAKKREDSH